MTPQATTIQIYCPSGEPRGVRIVEITTRIVQAVAIPRAKLDEGMKRQEVRGTALYFLFGDAEGSERPRAYIGETDDCLERLDWHHRNSEFWNIAVMIVSRTRSISFTKTHGKMLEWLALDRAARGGRYELVNANSGGKPNMSESMSADVAVFFETTAVLLGTLGFPILEPAAGAEHADSDDVFMCRRGGAEARGIYNTDGFVVLAGSVARRETTPSSHDGIELKREDLRRAGVLTDTDQGYRFERDHIFPTPSTAAAIVTGGNANGWVEWKNDKGQTLDQVYRKGAPRSS